MNISILNTREDLNWLWQTHLAGYSCLADDPRAFKVAVLHGNEDHPMRVDLYSEDDCTKPYLRFEADDDGLVCRGIAYDVGK